jgi:hypothetical protein
MIPRACILCGRPFRARRCDTKLCSKRCRHDHWRAYKTEWQQRRRLDPAFRERERRQQADYRQRSRGRHG